MKLPHITIEYREEESFAAGKLSWALIFGFAVHWAWIYLAVMNVDTLFSTTNTEMKTIGYGVSLAVFAVTLLSYGIFLEPARRLFATAQLRRRNRLVGACLVFAGTAILAFAGLFDGAGAIPAVCSGVFTGIGSAILLMSYGVSFSVCDIATVSISTAFSLFIGMVIYAAIMMVDLIAHPVGALTCLAFPFIELACLNKSSAQLVDNLEFGFATMPVHTAPFALHVFLPSLAFGFILGIVRIRAVVGDLSQTPVGDFAMALVLAGAAASVLVVASVVTQRQHNNFMFRTLLPVVALLVASLVLAQSASAFYTTFALLASYLLLEACAWVFYADISQRFRISAFTVFGFGRGSLALGALLGFAIMMPMSPFDTAMQDYGVLTTIALVSLMFGMSLLPKNSELRRTLKQGVHCLALYEDEEIDDALLAPGISKEQARPQIESPTQAKPPATPEVEQTSSERPPSPHVMSALDEAEELAASAEQNHPERKDRIGRFKRKCAAVAETFLLSRKETEVLFLLAKGYNSAAIQERLFISAGTANTHMRHIYRKLGVHSQQELMALVESIEDQEY